MKANYTHLNNFQSLSGSHNKLCYNGLTMESCKSKRLTEGTEGMSTPTSHMLPRIEAPKGKNIFMLESHQQSNRRTFKDKLLFCKPVIQHMKLSKTLDQASISEEGVLCPFWKESLKETYQKLWLPIETDLQDLDSNCSSTSLQGLECPLKCCQMMISKSLTQSSLRTSYRSLRFSQPDTTVPEPTLTCKKIRFYPNLEQKRLLNQCLGASRFFYNHAIAKIKEVGVKGTGILNISKLRPLVMKSDFDIKIGDPMSWQKEIPYDTRQEAISDAITAFKSALTNSKRNNITHFEISFRSKKALTSQSFRVNKKTFDVSSLSLFPRRLKENAQLRVRRRDKKKLDQFQQIENNFNIVKIKPDNWYLCLPKTKEPPIFENATYKSVFLDPGVRTFQTFYSPDGICGKIGGEMLDTTLKVLASRHDHIWSLIAKGFGTSKTRVNMKHRCAKLRYKMRRVVDDLHWQTCAFLCNNFQNIFLPSFEVSEMVYGSPLGSKITRRMLQLSQGKFKERLKYFAKTKQRNLYIVNESYTTKTCGSCGNMQDMEGKRIYTCEKCECEIDRDYNGARNICLRVLTKLI